VINARAARDNVLQGSLDLLQLSYLVHSEGLRTTDQTATLKDSLGHRIPLDPNKIAYFGHSQGTTIAYPFLLADPYVKAAVLSGAGAELALSVLNKTKPIPIADVAGMLFADRGLTRIHPMLNILAQMFGPADAVAYADPLKNQAGRKVPILITFGVGDNYSPDVVQQALFTALDEAPFARTTPFTATPPLRTTLSAADATPSPSGGNIAVVRIDLNDSDSGTSDREGHFAAFNHAKGRLLVEDFLVDVKDGNPLEVKW
jgi:pimeloyl-ACP methyl ester carboxylesterase